ncbi:MAG: hypothetical protein WA979_07965 [Pacificimonas sp.]
MRLSFLLGTLALILSACAPSPYYTGGKRLTPGEVPRDEYGQPVLEAIGSGPLPEPEIVRPTYGRLADIPAAKPLPTSPDRPIR